MSLDQDSLGESRSTKKATIRSSIPSEVLAIELQGSRSAGKPLYMLELNDLIKDSEYQSIFSKHYATQSSRTNPIILNIPIGAWKYDDTWKGKDGYMVSQLRLLDPKDLIPSEGDQLTKGEYKPYADRKEDIDRYVQWMDQGMTPPPIEVVETKTGKLRITDGHRRWFAALTSDHKIRAWVSPTVFVEETMSDGSTLVFDRALTFEHAKRTRSV